MQREVRLRPCVRGGASGIKNKDMRRCGSDPGAGKGKRDKGGRWMPWLSEAMKGAVSCDKPRVGANGL